MSWLYAVCDMSVGCKLAAAPPTLPKFSRALNILQKDYSPTPCRLTQTSLKGQQIANFILSLVSTVLLLLLGAGGPPSGLRAAR
jgi:hypothetical protein